MPKFYLEKQGLYHKRLIAPQKWHLFLFEILLKG